MKPGATTWCSASITRSPSDASTRPIAAITPSFTPTSPRKRGIRRPSTIVPCLITTSNRLIAALLARAIPRRMIPYAPTAPSSIGNPSRHGAAMNALAEWRSLDRKQRNAFLASFLGWTLDAFDFFLMVFVLRAVAGEFGTDVHKVSVAVTLTLAMRPLGALVFGTLADRFGRRPVLMADILLFSLLELASAFAPSLLVLLIMRAAFGFAMGGEWGIGASLTMETLPARARGLASGLLQEGYACGYLLAAIVYGLLFDTIGWRGMFAVGVLPALLVVHIRRNVEESPAWHRMRARPRRSLGSVLRGHGRLFLYVVVLMTAFNFFSHGT